MSLIFYTLEAVASLPQILSPKLKSTLRARSLNQRVRGSTVTQVDWSPLESLDCYEIGMMLLLPLSLLLQLSELQEHLLQCVLTHRVVNHTTVRPHLALF